MTNIRDLAKLAGVSVTTVSRVLNDHPYVSKEKREAVLRAVKETNYYKNINAVHLSTGKTMLIGVVLPYSHHPYFALLLKGMAKQALENNYKLVLFQSEHLESREREALQMLKQKQIDALIICSRACDWAVIEEHVAYGPIVVCENQAIDVVSSTFVDHYDVFMKALDYLYNKGHRRIGYCIGRKVGKNSFDRDRAYRDFLQKNKLPYTPHYVIAECSHFEDGEKVMNHIIRMDQPPTAFLVTSDQVAAGMVTFCQQVEIAIPGQLAIIGFDNQPIAKMMDITTIDIPLEEMGQKLFQQAVNEEITHREIEVTLIERGTV